MRDIYQDVTDKIITALDQGVAPWIKPWASTSSSHTDRDQPYPINAVTQRPYAGINLLLLWAEARLQGFTQDRWLTFNQAKKAGGHIRKGEHSTLAVLYKPMEREEQTESGQPVLDENGQPKVTHFGILRTHFLFNVEQTEGVEALTETPIETEPSDPFQASSVAKNLLLASGAEIVHRPASEAFYHPLKDFIQLPTKAQFHDEGGYYTTALHELTHWTGHLSRLRRGESPLPVRSAHRLMLLRSWSLRWGLLFYVPTPVSKERFDMKATSTSGSRYSRQTNERYSGPVAKPGLRRNTCST